MTSCTVTVEGRDLVLTRIFDAAPARVFRCWTDPALLRRWFCPLPWTVASVQTDVRPGGSTLVVMRSPEGKEFPCPGVYLEVVPDRRLVFTDAYTSAWQPSEKPFMTVILDFEDLGDGRTRYTARARHWSIADREQHEQMGFATGWSQCAEQLAGVLAG